MITVKTVFRVVILKRKKEYKDVLITVRNVINDVPYEADQTEDSNKLSKLRAEGYETVLDTESFNLIKIE